jgi:predicted nucleic acid-binding protein
LTPLSLIVDTGPLFASIDRSDANHLECLRLLSRSREELVLPSPVLVELDHFIWTRRLDPKAFSQLLHDIRLGHYRMADLSTDQYARVQELYEEYADLRLGFVDAAIIAIAEGFREPKIATLDHRHFSVVQPRGLSHLVLLP